MKPKHEISMFALLLMIICILIGCAGKVDYSRPISPIGAENSVTLNKSKAEVWKKIVPALGKQFFVINNLDKDSGIINVSYKGDPEKYVDCGQLTVKNASGEITYDFPASKAYQEYEDRNEYGLFRIKRTMDLDGRMNIIVEEIAPNKTRVTVNTRYMLTKKSDVFDVQGRSRVITDSMSFNSGQQGTFASGKKSVTCQCNGNLEKEVLSLLLDKP